MSLSLQTISRLARSPESWRGVRVSRQLVTASLARRLSQQQTRGLQGRIKVTVRQRLVTSHITPLTTARVRKFLCVCAMMWGPRRQGVTLGLWFLFAHWLLFSTLSAPIGFPNSR